nr:MAG TPA: hypothetical protein [Caudoviricetes sp.]
MYIHPNIRFFHDLYCNFLYNAILKKIIYLLVPFYLFLSLN